MDWGSNSDPGRIAAQIVSGIGFLGAGTILHNKGTVQGLTTAATLWVVAAIGMAVGARAYFAAVIGTSLVMLALMLLWARRRPFDSAPAVRPQYGRNHQITGRHRDGRKDAAGVRVAVVDTMSIDKGQNSVHASFRVRGLAEKWDEAIKGVLAIDGVDRIDLS